MNDERDCEEEEASPAEARLHGSQSPNAIKLVPRGVRAGWRSALDRQLEALRLAALREDQNPRHGVLLRWSARNT